jgi:hypothetical protein
VPDAATASGDAAAHNAASQTNFDTKIIAILSAIAEITYPLLRFLDGHYRFDAWRIQPATREEKGNPLRANLDDLLPSRRRLRSETRRKRSRSTLMTNPAHCPTAVAIERLAALAARQRMRWRELITDQPEPLTPLARCVVIHLGAARSFQ